MDAIANRFYQFLLALACISMVAAFVSVLLGIIGRQIDWNLPGLDAYAGYSIAATLFLALPASLQHGDHIRVTLLLRHLPPGLRSAFEYGCLLTALSLAILLAWFASRLAWVSYTLHDVSPAADATPLWIPQMTMVLGCIGFAMAFLQALVAHWRKQPFFHQPDDGEFDHAE